jgi:hypothetical protein
MDDEEKLDFQLRMLRGAMSAAAKAGMDPNLIPQVKSIRCSPEVHSKIIEAYGDGYFATNGIDVAQNDALTGTQIEFEF